MKLGCATVLLLVGFMAVIAAGERQTFCYKRVGYTRKYAEKQHMEKADESCEGPSCVNHEVETRPVIQYKTELVFRTERHCCAGYQRDQRTLDSCLPVCSRGCPQGELCTAPNRCECVEGHERDSKGQCVAVSAPLAGDEPATLQSWILSYVNFLLDGVKALGWAESDRENDHTAISALPRHKENLIARTAAEQHSEEAAATCQGAVEGAILSGVLDNHWNNSHSNCSSDGRPLMISLALTAARLSTAHSQ